MNNNIKKFVKYYVKSRNSTGIAHDTHLQKMNEYINKLENADINTKQIINDLKKNKNYINNLIGGELKHEIIYDVDGRIKEEGYLDLEDGKKTGKWTYFNYDNNQRKEHEYVDGLKNGKSITFDENDRIIEEGDYENNNKTGKWIYFDHKNNIKEEIEYLNGHKNGKTVLYENDVKISEGEYVNDEIFGLWTKYSINGEIISTSEYFDDHRIKTEYYSNGNIDKHITFLYGDTIDIVMFYNNENNSKHIHSIVDFNNRDTGELSEWYENEKIKKKYKYVNDRFNDVFREWYENGNKKEECNYDEGNKHGLCLEWFENGNRKSECNYDNGNKHGQCTEWYEDNEALRSKGNYLNGEEYDFWSYYNIDGSYSEGEYKNGRPDVVWTYHNSDGTTYTRYFDGGIAREQVE